MTKKRNLQYYLKLDYPIHIERMEDGVYSASIPQIKGCKGYAKTTQAAIEELLGVKEALIELMIEQGKQIPEPLVRLEIPVSKFSKIPARDRLKPFIKTQ